MKFLKTRDGDYVNKEYISEIYKNSCGGLGLYEVKVNMTTDTSYILAEFDKEEAAQAYLDKLIKELED